MMIARFPTIDEWADHVADQFVALLNAKPNARLCLPTGNTPLPVYERVAAAVRDRRVSFCEAEVFLLDEFGGVPADAAGRCDVMLRRGLIDHVDLPEDAITASTHMRATSTRRLAPMMPGCIRPSTSRSSALAPTATSG